MKEHYGFSDNQIKRLQSFGVGTKELYISACEFRVHGTREDTGPLTKVNLMCFIDKHGDFTENKTTLQKIAFELFNNLDKFEQKEIFKYLE